MQTADGSYPAINSKGSKAVTQLPVNAIGPYQLQGPIPTATYSHRYLVQVVCVSLAGR